MIKKNAFTLQEALITVGIIGIVAAITVPALTKLLPNPYQTRYLKAYEAITTLTKEMLLDPNLYWYNSDGNGCDGLACNTVPANGSVPNALQNLITDGGNVNNPSPVQKYAAILAYNMQVPVDTRRIFDLPNSSSFITANGIEFDFFQNGNSIQINIDVDMNGPDVDFNQNNFIIGNELPHQHSFLVNINGDITPGDPLGLTYLDNPTVTNKKDIIQLSNNKRNSGDSVYFSPTNDIPKQLCIKGLSAYCRDDASFWNNNDGTRGKWD